MTRAFPVQPIFLMSNLLIDEIIGVLTFPLQSTLVITVGNTLRSDDGVGSYIAARLQSYPGIALINVGTMPENIVDEVIAMAPATIIIIDAADFGGPAGAVKIIPEESIPQVTLSTHMIPLNVVTNIIRDSIRTGVYFVGIQPKSVALGEGLSPEVQQAADELISVITNNTTTKQRVGNSD